MENKIDPLLRGIYYMYLNDEPPETINDLCATYELAKIWHAAGDRSNWTSPLCCLYMDRDIFVKELVKRNG